MQHLTIFPTITRDHRSLERYLSELKHIPLIEAEEEIRLARRIRKGDQQALEKLVRANLRFVVSVAKQYQNTYIPLMDLISEGNIGLVEAARRFDETKGFKFISYAVWWIRKSILAALSEHSRLIRLPMTKIRALRELQEVMTWLEQQLERQPTEEELAAELAWSVTEIRGLLAISPRRLSVHTPLEAGEAPTLLNVLIDDGHPQPDHHLVEPESQRSEIDQLLAGLKKREQRILRLCYGLPGAASGRLPEEPMSYDEIGKQVGLCGERVRLLKHRELKKLRVAARLPFS